MSMPTVVISPLMFLLFVFCYPLNGMDVSTVSTKETPLHLAARKGSVTLAQELLNLGVAVDARDNNGETPLHWAVREGNVGVARLLLKCGANPKHRNSGGQAPYERDQANAKFLRDLGQSFSTLNASEQLLSKAIDCPRDSSEQEQR